VNKKLTKMGIELLDNKLIFNKPQGRIIWQLPSFPLSGGIVSAVKPVVQSIKSDTETEIECFLTDTAKLIITVSLPENSSFVRLRYRLEGCDVFPGSDSDNPICYGALETGYETLTEITLSNFDRIHHSYIPGINENVAKETRLIGPIITAANGETTQILAYEHGAQAPDSYLAVFPDEGRLVLCSVKGNYYRKQPINQYLAPWITLGISNIHDVLPSFRKHVMTGMGANEKSRFPYIFYNTWNHQERMKIFKGQKYLTDMTEERMLSEIDAAHKMGIDVFVIDTGWFAMIGDWLVNPTRFPGQLKNIKQKLESYGMTLGLWFNPTLAASESEVFKKHPDFMMKSNGKDWLLDDVWENGSCYGMCLASGFTDFLIEKSVELHEKLGVSYFKWDGIYQHGCDSNLHYHGGDDCSREEILDAYSYRMGLELTRAAEEISKRCNGAIVDFDITEGGRYVGLGFLSSGKFFSINNGPYYECFDIPASQKREPDPINVFFYPGAARSQICRASSRFDKIIPSTLFLTHYLPEGDEKARRNAAASLVLGGNGIWGDIVALSEEEISFWSDFLVKYKKVREDAAAAYPIIRGEIGASPEIHEKINPETGVGFVAFFTNGGGEIIHITQKLSKKPLEIIGAEKIEYFDDGRIKVTVKLEENGAATVFFI